MLQTPQKLGVHDADRHAHTAHYLLGPRAKSLHEIIEIQAQGNFFDI
jgi:hypothetical protein